MTNTEALKDFKKFVDVKTSNDLAPSLVDVVIRALEKQIPEKKTEEVFYHCGNCEMKIDSMGWGWCPYCGRAIDWGDGE